MYGLLIVDRRDGDQGKTSNAALTAASQAPATGKAEPLRPHQVAPAVKTAYQGASAVHIKASLANSGSTIVFDLQFNKDSASGTVIYDGTELPVILVDGVCYGQITDALITKMGISPTSAPGAALRNKWVSSEAPMGSRLPSGLKDMLSYNTFVPKLLGTLDSETLTAADSDTVNVSPFSRSKARAARRPSTSPLRPRII